MLYLPEEFTSMEETYKRHLNKAKENYRQKIQKRLQSKKKVQGKKPR